MLSRLRCAHNGRACLQIVQGCEMLQDKKQPQELNGGTGLHCPVAWCSDPTDHIPSKAFATTVHTSIKLEWKC